MSFYDFAVSFMTAQAAAMLLTTLDCLRCSVASSFISGGLSYRCGLRKPLLNMLKACLRQKVTTMQQNQEMGATLVFM